MSARRHAQHRPQRVPHLGGVVTVTPVRSRVPDEPAGFTVSWHSPGGDLRWLSPRIRSQENADVAADVLASFVQAAVAR
jgi:hypothetical protein